MIDFIEESCDIGKNVMLISFNVLEIPSSLLMNSTMRIKFGFQPLHLPFGRLNINVKMKGKGVQRRRKKKSCHERISCLLDR